MRNASAPSTIRRLMTVALVLPPTAPARRGSAVRSGRRYGHRQPLALELGNDLGVVCDRFAQQIPDRHAGDALALVANRRSGLSLILHPHTPTTSELPTQPP